MSIGSSNLAGMPQNHREKLENGVKLLLLWVAASDGKLEEAELELISSQFPDHSGTISNDEFLAVIRTADIESIEKAIRLVAAESRELRLAFIDMAVAMSMVDRDIAIAENHILRFYADALHVGTASLEKRFLAIAGSPLQEPGDASSATWWDEHEVDAGEDSVDDETDVQPLSHGGAAGSKMTIAQARSILGVRLNASAEDIEAAYQNLAGIFQVSRVESMGEAAVSMVNSRFKKIQEAYWLLKG